MDLTQGDLYPAIIQQHFRNKLPSCLQHQAIPGFELDSLFKWLVRASIRPDWHIEAVNGNVLDCLGAQQMQKVHLDSSH